MSDGPCWTPPIPSSSSCWDGTGDPCNEEPPGPIPCPDCPACPTFPANTPLPTPTRFTVPVQLTSQLISLSANARDLLVQVKNAWKAKGWTVVQSYSVRLGVLSPPGVDAWTTYADLLGTSGGGPGNSWIVLANPGLGTAQVCIEITVGGTLAWSECGITLAPAGGFTGGTSGGRPTAPNEITTNSQQWMGTGPIGNPQFYASVWVSPDAQYTRVAWWYGGKCISWWQIDLVQHASPSWTMPTVFVFWKGGNDYTAPLARMNIFNFTLVDSSAGVFKRSRLTAGTLIAWQGVDEGQQPGSTNYAAALHAGVNDWTGQYPWFSPIGLDASGRAAGSNGFAGYLTDQWWTVAAFNDGDTAGSQQYIIIQQMILQWGAGAPLTGGASVDHGTNFYGRSTG